MPHQVALFLPPGEISGLACIIFGLGMTLGAANFIDWLF